VFADIRLEFGVGKYQQSGLMLYSLDLMSQTTTMPAQYSVSDMSARFQQKSAQSEACYMSRFLVHQATFQAYKSRNEDRAVAFECDIGLVLAIFDGAPSVHHNTLHEAHNSQGIILTNSLTTHPKPYLGF